MAKAQYQRGNLMPRKRANGPDIWQFRWWETNESGKRVQHSRIIGTLEEYPTERAAQRAVDAIRLEVNAELPKAVPITVGALVLRYQTDPVEIERLAYSTRNSYRTFLKNWITPKWGDYRLEQVRTMEVEQWLRGLKLAPRTKVHIRNIFHVLFEYANRWELSDRRNPIDLVRQGGYRQADPDILSSEEFRALLSELTDEAIDKLVAGRQFKDSTIAQMRFDHARARMMVILAACLGLTRSEFTGLKWSDFDFQNDLLTVQRGVVNNHIGNTKTFARRKPIPLAAEVVAALKDWRAITPYREDTDWTFASGIKEGKLPYSPDSVLKWLVKPAAKRAKIGKRLAWHSLRHAYSTLLRANGTDVKVQSELMRHSNIQTTLQIYTQAVSQHKREANAEVVKQLLKEPIAATA
jgi:integrase